MAEESRPKIATILSGEEFCRWYWLKSELVAYCRDHKIPYSAGKFELTDRIAHYLDTGEIVKPKRKKSKSSFDWANKTLSSETIITDNYKNNQNVRKFMKSQIGTHFSFNTMFMKWMKSNTGKTLADAIIEWQRLDGIKQDTSFQSNIADHNQLNQYFRDFFADNPDLKTRDAHRCWDYKRSLPSDTGRHVYDSDDLIALDDS